MAPLELFDYTIDLVQRTLTVHGPSPRTHPMPPGLFRPNKSRIERIVVQPSRGQALLRLPPDVEMPLELGLGRSSDVLLHGRPIVYLDQNKWSTVARWLNDSASVSPADGAAIERLVELVERKEVVTPASGGHLVETGPLYGDPRIRLANTVLSLSRGWRMRNPIPVRSEELRAGLSGAPMLQKHEVFEPNAQDVLATPLARSTFDDTIPELAALSSELVSALALHDALIDPAQIPDEGGRAKAEAWAGDWERVARAIHAEGWSSRRIRGLGHARLLADVAPETLKVAGELGLRSEESVERLMDKSDPVASMPYLSRARGVLTGRMLNNTQRWSGNHLVDINYLCCAAGYADVVVGERQTIGYLRQVEDLPHGAASPARSLRVSSCWIEPSN